MKRIYVIIVVLAVIVFLLFFRWLGVNGLELALLSYIPIVIAFLIPYFRLLFSKKYKGNTPVNRCQLRVALRRSFIKLKLYEEVCWKSVDFYVYSFYLLSNLVGFLNARREDVDKGEDMYTVITTVGGRGKLSLTCVKVSDMDVINRVPESLLFKNREDAYFSVQYYSDYWFAYFTKKKKI